MSIRCQQIQLFDVRSFDEFVGKKSASRGNLRLGTIPGAVHTEWDNFLDESELLSKGDGRDCFRTNKSFYAN